MSLLRMLEKPAEDEANNEECMCCTTASRNRGIPAKEWMYPAGASRHWCPVSAKAVAKVDAIRDQAIALGWDEAKLYQNRSHLPFSLGAEYGLVCFLDGAVEVGAVTAHAIEIIHRHYLARPGCSTFYYPDIGLWDDPDSEPPLMRPGAAVRR